MERTKQRETKQNKTKQNKTEQTKKQKEEDPPLGQTIQILVPPTVESRATVAKGIAINN